MHPMWVTRPPFERLPFEEKVRDFLQYLAIIVFTKEENQAADKGQGRQPEERRTVSSRELHAGLKRGTKRKLQAGDDPGGEEEPPKD